MTSILQIGFGPLGVQIAEYIAQKETVKTVAVVDINPDFTGKKLSEVSPELSNEVKIYSSVKKAINELTSKPDVAIITTVSSLEKLIPQIEEVAKLGISVISTCEELSYPWELQPELSTKLDNICREHNIACLGTGINPGFLMDYLPSVMSSVCKDIETITVERIQDATPRRVPFQQKIGAGLTLQAFKEKEATGTLRHVGLKESVYLLANSIGLKLDEVTESLAPVIAENEVASKHIQVKKGDARGVEQIAHGYVNGMCKITLHFKAAIGEPRSYDKISSKGIPNFSSEIEGGINGDIATCAITINCINSILTASSGLRTMADIAVPGYIN
ncbi:NAD(P)H-dependent amine dehydrogenase family protein [Tenacibaculum crassostreae]|uniref:NAD(P)H-dependent amine dehydrogenase family protein n=1 Tax=Tenacibaculum crassostreae TaxID=502683 RepID=UPI0038936C0B